MKSEPKSRRAACPWGMRARSSRSPTRAASAEIAREVIARNLSVRETEAMVKRVDADAPAASATQVPAAPDVHTRAAEDKLRLTLGTRVRINRKGKGGRIEIDFGSEDELHRLYEHLTSS